MKLSILMNVRNGAEFLAETLDALMPELNGETEVIAVDDGSKDASVEILSRYPVRLFQPGSIGLAEARNFAFSKAKGEFVTFLDQDDVTVCGNFQRRLDFLATHPEIPAVVGEIASVIGPKSEALGDFYTLTGRRRGEYELNWKDVQAGAPLPGAIWLYLFRRSFFESVGKFQSVWETITDQDFLYRALQKAPLAAQPIPVARYRIHSTNSTIGWGAGRLIANPRVHALGALLSMKYQIRPPSPESESENSASVPVFPAAAES